MSICYWIGLLATVIHLPCSALATELLLKRSSRPLQAESTLKAMEPWETPIAGFFVRSHHGLPAVPSPDVQDAQWVLRIDGLVEKPLSFTLAELKKMQVKSLHAVLECSGNGRGLQRPSVPGVPWKLGAVGNAEWSGVKVSDLLERAGVKATAHFVRIEGADLPPFSTVPVFIRSVPLSKILQEETLVAWSMNREPLPLLHGGPLRLVLAGWYGENWTKWLTHLTLTETEDTGFFMKKGYRMPQRPIKPGEPWDSSTGQPIEELLVQSFMVQPVAGQSLPQGQIQVAGKAFSGAGPISKVELSIDEGQTWQPAEVTPPRKSGGWQEFHKKIVATALGPLRILARATDSHGNRQPLEHTWNPGGYLRNAVDPVQVNLVGMPVTLENPLITNRCLTCHTRELIESQRLTTQQWEGVLKKMEGFGVRLEAEEHRSLLSSLQKFTPAVSEMLPPLTSYESQVSLASPRVGGGRFPRGDVKRGAALFTRVCAVCHGAEGEGKLGPRLRWRLIPREEFWFTVKNGKGIMPPFATVLKKQEIADIHKFIQDHQP